MDSARELSGQFNGRAKPHGREGAIGRRPSWPRKCQARGPGRHRLSGRERILAEMLHHRGNRAVTNNSCSSETRADAGIERQSKTRAQEVVVCRSFFADIENRPG